MDIVTDLKKLIDGEVKNDEATLTTFSRDASVFEMKPKVVVAPKHVKDIKKLVKYADQNVSEGVHLTPRAAGTDMSGGPLTQSVVVNMMKHFDKVLTIGKDYAVTQPGVFYRDFDKKTQAKGLFLPSYPASRELCAVGGMVGNNTSGERTLCYGATIDYVSKLKMVCADGNEYTFGPLTKAQLYQKLKKSDFEGQLYRKMHDLIVKNKTSIANAKPRVSKNSMGYYLWHVMNDSHFDLSKIIVGSQGTLGVVTEIEFALMKPKKYHSLVVISLENLKKLDVIVNEVLKFGPESFECFDDQTLGYALKYFSEIVHRFKICSGAKLYLQFIPDFMELLRGKLPKLVLMADFSSDDAFEAINQAEAAMALCQRVGVKSKIISTPAMAEKYWVVRRESFRLLKGHAHHMTSAPIIDDITVLPQVLPEFLPKLNRLMKKYEDSMIYTLAGHIGSGNFHIIPLMDLSNETIRQVVPRLVTDVHNLVLDFDGSLAGEHNDGLIRGPFLEQMYGKKMYRIFQDVKNIFDPKGIFNPHKKVNITFEEALTYMHYN